MYCNLLLCVFVACIRRRTGAPCGFLYILSGYYHLKILIKTPFEIRGMKVFFLNEKFWSFQKAEKCLEAVLKGKFDQRRKFISLIGGNSKSGSGNALSRELHKCKSLLFFYGILICSNFWSKKTSFKVVLMPWFSSVTWPGKEEAPVNQGSSSVLFFTSILINNRSENRS